MKMKKIVACAALMTATCVSAPAFAGVSGNVGVFSDYIFRGITQTNGGASVQGGMDYSTDVGLYAGTWISNLNGGSASYETDIYGGYAGEYAGFGYDVGVIHYYYRGTPSASTTEFYVGGSFENLSAKVYYTDNAASSGKSAYYATANFGIPVTETVTITPAIGYSFGKAFDAPATEVLDYGISVSKELKEGFAFSFGLTGTDRNGVNDETLVLGLKKSFDF
jgi:uncharacterized protein (TIGR02001 family)